MNKYHVRGFTLLEVVISMAIVGIVFASGAVLIASAGANYFKNIQYNNNDTVNNINLLKAYNMLEIEQKNIYKILMLGSNDYIIASHEIGSSNTIAVNDVYMSQLVRMQLVDNKLFIKKYEPNSNGGTDTTYPIIGSNFNIITNSLVATTNQVANNIDSFVIKYLDGELNTIIDTSIDNVVYIELTITTTYNSQTQTRTFYLSQWRSA